MSNRRADIARKNLDARLRPFIDHLPVRPAAGWIRAIRDALGMTSRQLAKRMGVAQSRVVALEQAEKQGATTLKSMRDAAEALDCTFVYALVPRHSLQAVVQTRAEAKALSQYAQVAHAMLLENQALTNEQAEAEIVRQAREILSEPIRHLWDDE